MSEGHAAEGNGAPVDVNIPEIVEKRNKELKAERKINAEQTRQVDLQRIREMKSDTGIHPLELFPKEIWDLILRDKKLDPTDRWSAWQVHQLFRDLMDSSQLQDILMPQVFTVIESWNLYDEKWRDICFLDLPNEQRYSHHPGHLRTVSKSMRDAIDHNIEENLLQTMHGKGGSNFYVTLSCDDTTSLDILRQMLASFRDMLAKEMKPFFFPRALQLGLASRIYLAENNLQLISQAREDITSLLKIIGQDVWHCSFSFGDEDRNRLERTTHSLSEVYNLLRRWILLMPNLKWMKITGHPLIDSFIPPTLATDYPYPLLNSLERVYIKFYENSPAQFAIILRLALEAARGVRILKLDKVEDRHLELLPEEIIKSFPLTNLSILRKTEEMECSDLFITELDDGLQPVKLHLDVIIPLINFEWQLTTLKLQLVDQHLSLEDLFQFVGRFPTLVNVELWPLFECSIGNSGNNIFDHLNLPNLTNLTLTIFHPRINYKSNIIHVFFSLQFLAQHCRKLTTLQWSLRSVDHKKLWRHLKKHERLAGGNLLDFRAGLRTLYDSVIWDVFPLLKFVKITISPDNHEGYFCNHEYRRKHRDYFMRKKGRVFQRLAVARSSDNGCPQHYCAALNA